MKTTVTLPGQLWHDAKLQAITERSTLKSVIIVALEKYLAKQTGSKREG